MFSGVVSWKRVAWRREPTGAIFAGCRGREATGEELVGSIVSGFPALISAAKHWRAGQVFGMLDDWTIYRPVLGTLKDRLLAMIDTAQREAA